MQLTPLYFSPPFPIMKHLASIIGTVLLLSPLVSSAQSVKIGNTLVPSGFCQQQTIDGVFYIGVRFDGVPYQLWLDANSLGKDRLKEMVKQANQLRHDLGMQPFSELEEAQFVAVAKKAESDFQYNYILRAQEK